MHLVKDCFWAYIRKMCGTDIFGVDQNELPDENNNLNCPQEMMGYETNSVYS